MLKRNPILKWSLISLASLIVTVIIFGLWFISLIPRSQDRNALKQTKPSDLTYIQSSIIEPRGKILAVVSSCAEMGNTGKKTGYELTELARPYYVFQANGFEVDIASPKGGEPPVVIDDEDMGSFDYAFLNDTVGQRKVRNSLFIDEVNADDYDAIYFVGGKGAIFDFPESKGIQSVVREFAQSDKVIGAVCHGPAALVNVLLDNGQPLLSGKMVSGFTNEEELLLIPDAASIFPFLLQDKMTERGGNFKAGSMYLKNICVDGNLVTGQNPWSTWSFAETMIAQLDYTPKPRVRTAEENAVDVLSLYESEGYSSAKAKLQTLMLQEQKTLDRTLLIMHGIVAGMQWNLFKAVQMIRLAHVAKGLTEE